MVKMVSRSPVEHSLPGAPPGEATEIEHATRWAQTRQQLLFLTRGEQRRPPEQRGQVAPRADVATWKDVEPAEAAQEYDVGCPDRGPARDPFCAESAGRLVRRRRHRRMRVRCSSSRGPQSGLCAHFRSQSISVSLPVRPWRTENRPNNATTLSGGLTVVYQNSTGD